MAQWNVSIGTTFFDFLKKNDFSRFWLNIFYQKNKIVPKWEKVSFDGLFELAIVDLVGMSFKLSKLVKNCGFYEFFSYCQLLLYYYKY